MRIQCALGLILLDIFVSVCQPELLLSEEIITEIETPEVTESNGTDVCRINLDFSNMGLSTIKSNFISGLSIKSLALRHNSIQKFQTNTFDSLPNLENLDISNNVILKKDLFSFGPVPSLKSLILDSNSVYGGENNYYTGYSYRSCSSDTYYSSGYGCIPRYSALEMSVRFPEVTYLSLRNIYMDSISNYWSYQFPKVTTLDVSNNRLTKPDDFVEKLPSTVKNLTMENVGLTSLMIKSLKNVSFFNLNLNNFDLVSSNDCNGKTLCLENLDKLESLQIAGCSIKKIETHAFKELQTLIQLDISNNSLSEIPNGAFESLHSLSYLDMSQNSLTKVPDLSNLTNLKTLKMNRMQNDAVLIDLWHMSSWPKIQAISLQNNKITHIPEIFFTKLQTLEEIDLSNNQLTALPPGSWQMNVKKIHLNQNWVSKIEDLQLSQAKSLEVLGLEKNNITNIKLSVVKHLPDNVILKV